MVVIAQFGGASPLLATLSLRLFIGSEKEANTTKPATPSHHLSGPRPLPGCVLRPLLPQGAGSPGRDCRPGRGLGPLAGYGRCPSEMRDPQTGPSPFHRGHRLGCRSSQERYRKSGNGLKVVFS